MHGRRAGFRQGVLRPGRSRGLPAAPGQWLGSEPAQEQAPPGPPLVRGALAVSLSPAQPERARTPTPAARAPLPEGQGVCIAGREHDQPSLHFRILGQRLRIDCASRPVAQLVVANFRAVATAPTPGPADLHYAIDVRDTGPRFVLRAPGGATFVAQGLDDLLFDLEKHLTVALQRRRPELLFLHAAALARGGRAWLLAGDSGAGKSTTTWALLHHGWRYLSDELAPIDLASGRVHPYPRALCLKRRPPLVYPLPEAVLDLGRTLHVPPDALPGAVETRPRALGGIVFVRYRAGLAAPALRPLGRAEACARLYVVTLNALAHAGHGLDAAQRLAERVPSHSLECDDLSDACSLLESSLFPDLG